ncbi:hypothetical protein KUCAC02_016735, partial [Chaenocephalus aceratus]
AERSVFQKDYLHFLSVFADLKKKKLLPVFPASQPLFCVKEGQREAVCYGSVAERSTRGGNYQKNHVVFSLASSFIPARSWDCEKPFTMPLSSINLHRHLFGLRMELLQPSFYVSDVASGRTRVLLEPRGGDACAPTPSCSHTERRLFHSSSSAFRMHLAARLLTCL